MSPAGPPPSADDLPLVCVIVLNCNGLDHLRYCLPSLDATRYPRHVIMVVDNASSDESIAFVAREHRRAIVVRSDRNLGWSGGNNLGIRTAVAMGARYVVLANNDIRVDPRWLDEAVAVAEADPRIGIVGFQVFESGGVPSNDREFLEAVEAFREVDVRSSDAIGGMSMFVRSTLFDDLGFIDEGYFAYGEENDFQIRAQRAGYRTVSIGVPVWHYGQGSFGKVPMWAAMLQTRSNIRLFLKHGSFGSAIGKLGRHFRYRVLSSKPREVGSMVEQRLHPSRNPFVNLGLFLYAAGWNVWHLPGTIRARREDYRRVAQVKAKLHAR